MIHLKWLRRFIRRRTSAIPEDKAVKWKERLSLAYMLISWNVLGFVAYAWYQGKTDLPDYYGLKTEEEKNMSNNEYFARHLSQSTQNRLITIRGVRIVEDRSLEIEPRENQQKSE